MPNTSKRQLAIAVIYPEPILSTVPGLCHFIELVSQKGVDVDIYTTFSEQYERPHFEKKGVRLFDLDQPKWYQRKFPLSFIPSRSLLKTRLLIQQLLGRRYRLLIGVDPRGFIAVSTNNPTNTPIAYYSLELLIPGELEGEALEMRKEESAAIEQIKLLLISDEERESIFKKYNPSFKGNTIYFPNTPSDDEEQIEDLTLDKSKTIVNISGSTATWTGIDEIIHNTINWGDKFLFVIHCKSRADKETLLDRNPGLNSNKKILLTDHSFLRKQYKYFVSQVDIGIAFYFPRYTDRYDGINLLFIGKSSGKLAYYLMNGRPVLVNNIPYYVELLKKYKFGILINDIRDSHEIANALQQITAEYETYAKQAKRCFEQEFNFDAPLKEFIEAISE